MEQKSLDDSYAISKVATLLFESLINVNILVPFKVCLKSVIISLRSVPAENNR